MNWEIKKIKVSELKEKKRNPKVNIACEYCKKDFEVMYCMKDKRRFCSKSCSGYVYGKANSLKAIPINIKKNKNPDFIEKVRLGLKRHYALNPRVNEKWYLERYGKDYKPKKAKHSKIWASLSKQLRQKYNCQKCNKSDKLHVHHIIPYAISKDNSLINLVVLCNKCHKEVEDNNLKIMKVIQDWNILRILFHQTFQEKGRRISYSL